MGMSKKSCARYFGICKYLFSIFEKGNEQKKNCASYFEICKYAFLIFEEGDQQKIELGVSRFVSMPF